MSIQRKIGFIIVAVFVGLTDTFVYMNDHFYYRSIKQDEQKKIASLEKSNRFFPLNDLPFYELGKSYFELSMQSLSDSGVAKFRIQKSVDNLRKAIQINPSSSYSHYYLAQALLHLDVFSPGKGAGFLGEFRKAASLAGEDTQILNEAGVQLLSRWADLSQDDRSFTLEILRKIVEKRDGEKIILLLNTWELNAGDYDIIDKIIPRDSRIYRLYARFLGEKSLSLQVRQKYLTQADALDFVAGNRAFQSGETKLFRYQTQDALGDFQAALDSVRRIRFYQALTSQNSIGMSDFDELSKSILLNLAKCQLEQRATLKDVEDYLLQYLALENLPAKVSELETYLRDRRVLPEKFGNSFDDFHLLAFELLLLYKETRYRNIVDFGRRLGQSLLIVPEAQRPDYLRVLNIIGDSMQKVDYLYDAGDIYQKAKELDPRNLETLVRIRNNCDRLNDDVKKSKIEQEIENLISPKEIDFKSSVLNSEVGESLTLAFDGRKIALELSFGDNKEGDLPLISVLFNGRVVWEDYLKNGLISLSLETKIGQNFLQIIPVNRSVALAKLTYSFSNENSNLSVARRPS